jgi:beta-galactosidase
MMFPRRLIAALLAVIASHSALATRRVIDLDPGWRFSVSSASMGMNPKFDDSTWQTVNLPHDWSIDGPFLPTYGSGNGYAPGGQAWYRRHFSLRPEDKGQLVSIELDGVYDNAEVWLNGYLVGGRPYGFESFALDLTPLINPNGDNVLAVRVDHSRIADSRWYTGSGIYRDVRLVITDPLHLGHWGTYVTTPVVSGSAATVHVETEVDNASATGRAFTLQSNLIAPGGGVVASLSTSGTLESGTSQSLVQEMTIPKPRLWSPDSPVMYTLESRLSGPDRLIDEGTTPFGIRSIAFDPDHGFSLNGVPTKLKGVCIHQDGGSLGTAIPIMVWARRLETLKTLGVNAIRTSHNPPAPAFLDLCDQLGFLVMDEAFDEFTPGKNKWVVGWNQSAPSRFGYNEYFAEWSVRDITDIVRRDRNHPGIIMWSIGNEIDYPNDPFTDPALGDKYKPGNPPGTDMVKWGRPLVAAVKAQDRTRPVTAALASVAMSNAVGFAQILDIDGYNYQEYRYAADHKQYPARVMYGSENKHDYPSWLAVRDNPAISGQFLWTGIDYLGEAVGWPARANPDGLLDMCGFVKPMGRFRESLWSDRPMVYLCAAKQGTPENAGGDTNHPSGIETWNWPAGTPLTVSCYTNCPQVTLTLNGKPLGTKTSGDAVNGILKWNIPFEPGVLKAVAQKDGHTLCEYSLQTAGAPASIVLHPDVTTLFADGKDVAQVEFDILDANGVRVPDAGPELTFDLAGPAKILGIGNADVTNSEPPKAPRHRAFHGRGLAIIQATTTPGSITLKVTAPGLKPATVQWQSQGLAE